MDEKAQMIDNILAEEYIERLKQIVRYYNQDKDDYNSRLNAEAVQWAIDQIIS